MSIYKGSKLLAGWNKTDIATDAEFADGESNSKACSVKQTQDAVTNASRLPLFTPARFPFLANDVSWLRSDTFSWHSGAVYVSAYNLLKEQYEDAASTEEKDVIGDITITYKRTPNKMKICASDQMTQIQKLWDAENVAWYFILDVTNAQFKLPRSKYGFSGFGDNVGDYNTESLPNISQTSNWRIGIQDGQDFSYEKLPIRQNTTAWVGSTSGVWEGDGIEAFGVDASLSSPAYKDNGQVQERSTSSYLYFYVGRFDQKAIINTAGIKTEELNKKADADLSNLSVTGLNKLGGLEILSIVLMPLGIDESENKYRYLNGQIIIQDQFPEFTKKLKSRMVQFPRMFMTEVNWQAEKTNSKLGQCGKFVVDDTAGTIRLPCVVNAQGLVDLAMIGGIKSESLPNITASGIFTTATSASGAVYTDDSKVDYQTGDSGTKYTPFNGALSASRSSSTYQDNAPVQQEAIQYPYCIVVNTGVEEADRPINNYQVNNVYSYGMSQYYKGTMNNNSWLKSAGQWNDGTVYTGMYNWLVEQINSGAEGFKSTTAYRFKGNTTATEDYIPVCATKTPVVGSAFYGNYPLVLIGYVSQVNEDGSVILHDTLNNVNNTLIYDTEFPNAVNWITDYDFVVKTDQTFRLPLKNGQEGVFADGVKGNGMTLGLTDGAINGGLWNSSQYALDVSTSSYGTSVGTASSNTGFSSSRDCGITTDPSKSGMIVDKTVPSGWNLYYYIGDVLQNAQLINVARIEEKLTDANAASRGYVVDSYHNGAEWYRIYSDGWIEQGGTAYLTTDKETVTFNFLAPFSATPTVFTGIISNPTGAAYTGNKAPTTSSVDVFAGYWNNNGQIVLASARPSKIAIYACGY